MSEQLTASMARASECSLAFLLSSATLELLCSWDERCEGPEADVGEVGLVGAPAVWGGGGGGGGGWVAGGGRLGGAAPPW